MKNMYIITSLVSSEVGVDIVNHLQKTDQRQYGRYVAVAIMVEENRIHNIAEFLGWDNARVEFALKRADDLLTTDKAFKQLYLKCVARVALLEDLGEAA